MDESSNPTEQLLPLSYMERRFVDEYLLDFSSGEAAKRAGYLGKARGSKLLARPRVQFEVQRRCLEAQVRLEVTGDHIRQGFAQIAFDPREVVNGGPTRVERMQALRELGKLLGLYVDKVAFAGMSLEQLLAEVDKVQPIESVVPRLNG